MRTSVAESSIGVDLNGSFQILIPRDTALPARGRFTAPTVKSQSGLEIRLLKGESSRPSDNQLLRRVILDRSQVAAAERYPVVFTIYMSPSSELRIECRAQSTGRKLRVALDPPEDQAKGQNAARKPETPPVGPGKTQPVDDGWGTVYVLLDCSGSMGDDRLDQVKTGVADFAKGATKTYRVGLIRFDTHASLLCEPTKDMGRIEAEVKSIVASGSTNMAEAISLARQKLGELGGTRAILIATDGKPTSVEECLREAAAAKQDGIEMIAIGTSDAQEDLLKRLASKADLGRKVPSASFSTAISSACSLLPKPKVKSGK